MRVVLDNNIVVSALLWGGNPVQMLEAAADGRIELYATEPLLSELAGVLPRPKFAARILKAQRTPNQLIEQYRGLVEIVSAAEIAPVVVGDPDDDQVLACAVAAGAELIVTRDKKLRDLKNYQRIPIVDASEGARIVSNLRVP